MSTQDLDPFVQNLFGEAFPFESGPVETDDDAFTRQVLAQTDRMKRRKLLFRIALVLALAIVAVPMQDLVIGLTHVLVQSVFSIEDRLIAQLLAPINTVGTLLSAVLFSIRAVHKRLFI
ncbi:MAG: hypothetical protein O3A63_16765 [Proteobacteria bacterium]|nr:hypothetical protein [Pseudomonadota bacterium]